MTVSMWNRPDMRQALAHRDLQTVFRLMQRHGIPQRSIAALTGLAQSDVSAIVSGKRQVTAYAVIERLAHGLGLPRGWLGLAYDDETAELAGLAHHRPTDVTELPYRYRPTDGRACPSAPDSAPA